MSEPAPYFRPTTRVTAAYCGAHKLQSEAIPGLIRTIHASLMALDAPEPTPAPKQKPAVSIKKSVQPDHIICLEDGKRLKMLKRYLWTKFGMTPEQYRAKWCLPHDYPLVAPNYAQARSDLAKSMGLGTTPHARLGRKR